MFNKKFNINAIWLTEVSEEDMADVPEDMRIDTHSTLVSIIRNIRNDELTATDMYMNPDYNITDSQRSDISTYRQKLRDITKDTSSFAIINNRIDMSVFPEPPSLDT